MCEEAKQEITSKLNDFLIEEELERLKMEEFVLEHSIAMERSRVEELKMKAKNK